MQPLHVGNDRDGNPMAEWAMDALMELLQIKYKAMNFPNSREGWQSHSTNMPLVARAKVFCQTKYSRRFDVDSYDEQFFEFNAAGEKQDKANNKTNTKVPKRTKEKIMVSEVLLLVRAFLETDNRKMTTDTFWKELKNITTVLDEATAKENGSDNTEGRSHGEFALVQVNRELMQSTPMEDETPEELAEASDMDQMAWFDRLEDKNSALMDQEDEEALVCDLQPSVSVDVVLTETSACAIGTSSNTGERAASGERTASATATTTTTPNTNVSETGQLVTEEIETEVTIGIKKQKVKVRKSVLNRMALKDVAVLGRSKMISMKIPEIRFRKRCRIKREIATLQQELNNFLTNKEGETKLKLIMEKLKASKKMATCEKRVEYRMMKKKMWVYSSDY